MKKDTPEKINIVIDTQLKQEFNIKCIENHTNMSKVLKNFIKEYINISKVDLDEEIEETFYNSFKK